MIVGTTVDGTTMRESGEPNSVIRTYRESRQANAQIHAKMHAKLHCDPDTFNLNVADS